MSRKAKIKSYKETLEDQGHGLLIVDLLRLHRIFSFRRYKIDLAGFVAAWIFVFIILLLTVWFTKLGG
jgi:hypothetical protein